MSNLFKPKMPAAAQALPEPRVVRQPTETDPSILAAQQRTRDAAMKRRGRAYTIMTDPDMVGSSGSKLGA